MRILFDQGKQVPLRRSLNDHLVATAYELGWSTVTNGELIRLAEQEGYGLPITADTNLCHQQKGKEAKLANRASTGVGTRVVYGHPSPPTRSRKVCMTCHWFRHYAGVNCIPVLTSRCQGWSDDLVRRTAGLGS